MRGGLIGQGRRGPGPALAVLLTVSLTMPPATGAVEAGTSPPPIGAAPVVTLTRHGLEPAMVVDRAGTTTVVWATRWRQGPIRAARRSAGGAWSDPVTIGRGTSPLIAADARGDVTVLFETNRAGMTTGQSAVRRPAGGAWLKPVRLSHDQPAPGYTGDDEGTFGAHRAELAVNGRGDTVAVWQWGSYDRDRPLRIEAASRSAGGRWSDPVGLTRRDWSSDPQVAIDAAGGVTAVYSTRHDRVVSRRGVVGHAWRPPVVVMGRGSTLDDDLVMDRHGTATLTYPAYADGVDVLRAVRRPADRRAWGTPRQVSPPGVPVWTDSWTEVIGPGGTITVAMTRESGRIDVVRRPPGGPWGGPVEVSPAGQANQGPRVSRNAAGDLFVLWQQQLVGLDGRARHPGAGWSGIRLVTPSAKYSPAYSAAVLPDGAAMALWETWDGKVNVRRMSLPAE